MRSPEEKRIKNTGFIHNAWSVTQGDYVKRSTPDEETFKSFRKRENKKKVFITLFFLVAGYAFILVALNLLSKV